MTPEPQTPTPTPTPRSDANVFAGTIILHNGQCSGEMVPAYLARTLERELHASENARAELQRRCDCYATALREIARPALGGKNQQIIAQRALARPDGAAMEGKK